VAPARTQRGRRGSRSADRPRPVRRRPDRRRPPLHDRDRSQRTPPSGVPFGVVGHLRVEHRHLDAEHRARCIRLPAHPFSHLCRPPGVRPTRTSLPAVHRRWGVGRRRRPAAPAHRLPGGATGLLPRPRLGGVTSPPLDRDRLRPRAGHRHRQCPERPSVHRSPAGARPQAGPARSGVAPIGPDEPVPGDRAGNRRPAAPLRRRLGDLHHQRRNLRLRHRGDRPGVATPSKRHGGGERRGHRHQTTDGRAGGRPA
jgi:hypothetical protein